jgi:hypothetical protein
VARSLDIRVGLLPEYLEGVAAGFTVRNRVTSTHTSCLGEKDAGQGWLWRRRHRKLDRRAVNDVHLLRGACAGRAQAGWGFTSSYACVLAC